MSPLLEFFVLFSFILKKKEVWNSYRKYCPLIIIIIIKKATYGWTFYCGANFRIGILKILLINSSLCTSSQNMGKLCAVNIFQTTSVSYLLRTRWHLKKDLTFNKHCKDFILSQFKKNITIITLIFISANCT